MNERPEGSISAVAASTLESLKGLRDALEKSGEPFREIDKNLSTVERAKANVAFINDSIATNVDKLIDATNVTIDLSPENDGQFLKVTSETF